MPHHLFILVKTYMETNNTSPSILTTRKHFEILDGLRGIAALAVVTFHFMEWAYTDYSKDFIGHGFLAVEFFFCLSGFVIAYAYDNRIEKMGVTEFFKSRLIRLHPLVILGSVLGLLAFLFDPFGGNPELYSTGKIVLIFLCSVLLIPWGAMADRGLNLFSFNAPSWSLFWEYIANIIYAWVLYKMNRRLLLLLTILSAIPICIVCYRAGNLMGGWSGPTFWDGGIRVSYSFLAGLLIYRSNWIIKNSLGFIGVSFLLFLAFISPFSTWNWISEPLIVLFYFPFMISLGAGARLTNGLKKPCLFLGKISYPLYMTHYAVLWMFGNYYLAHKPDTLHLALIIIAGLILVVAASWFVMMIYDIPVRKYLNDKRMERLARHQQTPDRNSD